MQGLWVGTKICPSQYIKTKLRGAGAAEQFPLTRGDRSRPENGGQSIIVRLWNGIELVIVTPRTFSGERQESGRRHMHHVFQTFVFVFLRIVRFVIPSPQAQEARSNYRLLIAIRQLIAR